MINIQTKKSFHWNGYNNLGICATAIGAFLNSEKSISLSKAMLIMPFVMHKTSLKFLAKSNVRERKIAAFVTMNPEFIVNFDKRYQESLVVSLNAIQLLITTGHIQFDGNLKLVKPLEINDSFGKRASLIQSSIKNLAALLASSEEELYLNLRVKL